MSYILDALRRADAERERERGDVPGLHSQPMAAAPAAGASSIAPWVAAAVLAGTGVSGAWWWFSRAGEAPAPVAAVMPASPPLAVPAAPPASASALAAAAPPVAADRPLPSPPAAAIPPRAAAAPAATPVAPVAPAPAPRAREREREPAAMPGPAAVETPAAAPAPAPAPAATQAPSPSPSPPAVIAYEQLPEDVRRQLPVVAIGGAIYSDVPAARLLIVAGQLLREGDAVAPGVTLEQIRPRSAILRWRALRYEMAF